MVTAVLATGAGSYVHWGAVQISVTNLVIVGLMLVLFALAIVVPFPAPRQEREPEDRP